MTEVTLKQPGALAEVPMDLVDMERDADLGGKLSLVDISVPYLYILQGLSPQVNPDHAKYIEGSKPGQLYMTNLERVYDGRDKGLVFVPCYYERLITEWTPREQGGGLVASHEPESPIVTTAVAKEVNGKMQNVLPNGHHLVETAYHYILVKDPDSEVWYQTIMPLKATSLKASRRMNSTIQTTLIPGSKSRAPRWLYKWSIKTVKEQKDTFVWSSPKFQQLDMVSADTYAAGKSFAIIAAKGLLRRVALESELENDMDSGQTSRKTIGEDGENMPF